MLSVIPMEHITDALRRLVGESATATALKPRLCVLSVDYVSPYWPRFQTPPEASHSLPSANFWEDDFAGNHYFAGSKLQMM
jgi:hypothetical protein